MLSVLTRSCSHAFLRFRCALFSTTTIPRSDAAARGSRGYAGGQLGSGRATSSGALSPTSAVPLFPCNMWTSICTLWLIVLHSPNHSTASMPLPLVPSTGASSRASSLMLLLLNLPVQREVCLHCGFPCILDLLEIGEEGPRFHPLIQSFLPCVLQPYPFLPSTSSEA